MLRSLQMVGLGLAAICACSAASAHEMWMKPKAFHLSGPGTTSVAFLVGDGLDITPWNVTKLRVTSLRTYGPAGVTDQMPGLREGEEKGGATATFTTPGAYVLAMESSHAFLELEAAKFNDYVKHEGLTLLAKDRTTPEAQAKPGREMYSRRAKSLIRVGEGDDDVFTSPIGMTLEIVPEKCPYHLERDERLPVTIYSHGLPLAGATVSLFNLNKPGAPAVEALSDAKGRVSFDVERTGAWMVGVVWSEPLPDRTHADYDTTFSSLTFGF